MLAVQLNQHILLTCGTCRVWDNGNEVCNGADGDPSGSQDTWYHLDCGNGAFVDVQGYGSRLNYTSADGYFVSLSSTDSNPVMGYTCGQTDHTIEGGTEAENVFADEYCGNCNTAQLCDYKSYCPDFDASCH